MNTAIPVDSNALPLPSTGQLFIGGRWQPAASGRTFETINPTNGRALGEVAEAGDEDVNRAVEAARKALEGPWGQFKPFERQQLLLRLADIVDQNYEQLALLDTSDMGAPLTRTRAQRQRAVGLLRYYAGLTIAIHGNTIAPSSAGDFFAYTLKEPVGVVASITPWNAPTGVALWKLGPVLATGCTIILKPAEQAPLSSLRLAELCQQAGFPEGVVNVLTGGAAVGAALAAHPQVDKVAFTGSTGVGQQIIRASAGNIKRVSLELGGKSANIVFADANMDIAVRGAAMAGFGNSGQVCAAGSRLFVERKIYDEFIGQVAAFAKGLVVGDPLEARTDLGPLVSAKQLDRVTRYCELGKQEGAQTVVGGGRLTDTGHADGYFVQPTVFGNVSDRMAIAREEIFGPVISALPFDTVEEVIRRGNDSPFGLAGGVWTRDISKANRVSHGIRTGTMWVNCYGMLDPAVPFGGYKMSGYGRESGVEHLAEYLNTKAVWINKAG